MSPASLNKNREHDEYRRYYPWPRRCCVKRHGLELELGG